VVKIHDTEFHTCLAGRAACTLSIRIDCIPAGLRGNAHLYNPSNRHYDTSLTWLAARIKETLNLTFPKRLYIWDMAANQGINIGGRVWAKV